MEEESKKRHALRGLIGVSTLLALILVIYVGVLARNAFRQYDYIGRSDQQLYTITISGEGKVTAIPDIAQVSLGIETQKTTVAAAQKENTEKMNSLVNQIKDLDIEEKDIKTANYSIYPRYDYLEGRQVLRGYIVNQSVNVKIRDLEQVAAVLDLAGTAGANQIGGLNFTIDEPEDLRQEAREEALANAKEKADALAKAADVKLGKLVSFSESSSGGYPQPVYRTYALEDSAGFGGGDIAPEIEPGSQDITVYVTVTYEVL